MTPNSEMRISPHPVGVPVSAADAAANRAHSRRVGEWVIEHGLLVVALISCVAVLLVLAFMVWDALPIFGAIPIGTFFFGSDWYPVSSPPVFGILAFVVGTLIVTLGSSLIAIPLGIACAAYLAELAPARVREFFKPIVELLAAVPSVVMGFIGLKLLSPLVQNAFNLPSGLCALSACIMLALMALPTVITISEDAISAVPGSYREASLGMGASPLATLRHVVLPAARSGLVAAAMLGVGRALGETMVVLMVAGNATQMPLSFLGDGSIALVTRLQMLVTSGFGLTEPVRTLTATLAGEMGEAARPSEHYSALFAIGALLCVMSYVITLISDFALHRRRR
jgi:phosphate transport system permease protein